MAEPHDAPRRPPRQALPARHDQDLGATRPARRFASPDGSPGPMTREMASALGPAIGNRNLSSILGGRPNARALRAVQRVPITAPGTAETLYENPTLKDANGNPLKSPTAADKQFVATPYTTGPTTKYEMTRVAKEVVVEVRIQFRDQARDENEFIVTGGVKTLNPNFAQDKGKVRSIPGGDPRRKFAADQCKTVTASWNHYDFVGKTKAAATGPAPTPGPAPAPATTATKAAAPAAPGPTTVAIDPSEVRLKVKFVATPVFDLAAPAHTSIALFGKSVAANRDGAHPVDSGHWYMNTKKNYPGAEMDKIVAHEYGHLLGIPDEYSRSDDQTHQMLHRMGGGAKTADKALDQSTVRQMVASALVGPILARLRGNLGTVFTTFTAEKANLTKQLQGAVNGTWADAGIRGDLTKRLQSGVSASLKSAVPTAVNFQAGSHLPAKTIGSDAMGNFTSNAMLAAVNREWTAWRATAFKAFTATGADGTSTTVSSDFSANVTDAATGGAVKTSGTSIVDKSIGGVPKISPSSSLLSQLAAVPAEWANPGKGLDAQYTPGIVGPQVTAAAESAVKGGAAKRMKSVHDLYVGVLGLVRSTARASGRKAVETFVSDAIQPRAKAQFAALQSSIETEVDAAMSMPAGALAAKSPPDPEIRKVADHMYNLLKSQQNAKSYDGPTTEPASGSAGTDIRQSSSSVMSSNDTSKAGFRSDFIAPVLNQFNGSAALKLATEENFRAEVTR